MKKRFLIALLAALGAALVAAAVAGAAMVGIYRNGLESKTQRAELSRVFGHSCKRGGGEDVVRVVLGKKNKDKSAKR